MPDKNFLDKISDNNGDKKIDGQDLKNFLNNGNNRKELWDKGIPELKNLETSKKEERKGHTKEAFDNLDNPCQSIINTYKDKDRGELNSLLKIGNTITIDNQVITLDDKRIKDVRSGMALVVLYHALDSGEKLYWDQGGKKAEALNVGAKYFCDSKGTDDKGANDKGTDDKGTDDKGANDKGTDDKGTDDKGTDDKGTDDKGANDKGTDSKGTDSKGTNDKGTDSKGANDKGTDSKGANDKGTDSKGTDKESVLIPEVSKSKEKYLDGVPEVITTGMREVEDIQRRDYLVEQMNSFLQTRIIGKEILGNNRPRENELINNFFTSLAILPNSLQTPTTTYDDVKSYYDTLLASIISNDRLKGTKLKIPAKVEEYDPKTKKIIFGEPNNKFLQNSNLEKKEIDTFKNILDNKNFSKENSTLVVPGIKQQMDYIHEQTVGKIYKLGMKESEKFDQANPKLDASTNTYKEFNEAFFNTSERINQLSKKLEKSLSNLSILKAKQQALESKIVNNPKDIITKQFDLTIINEDLFNAELSVISLGIQHDLLTNGKVETTIITERLNKIKQDLITSRNKMKDWIVNEGIKQKDAVQVDSDKLFIQSQLDNIKRYVDQTSLDEGRIDAMVLTMNNDIYSKYEENIKAMQSHETTIIAQTELKSKYETELKKLDARDQHYNEKKQDLDAKISSCTNIISIEKVEKEKIIKTYNEYAQKLEMQLPKQGESVSTANQQSAIDQKNIWDGLTDKNIPLLAMNQFPNLYTEVKSKKRDTDLTEKHNLYQEKITKELESNTTKNKEEKEKIIKEKGLLGPKITEVNGKIKEKEQEIKSELAKASSSEGYDISKVSSKQTELINLYNDRSDLLEKRNYNYSESQFNYQRELFNQKKYIDGFVDHTKVNVDKIKSQEIQVTAEWNSKFKRIENYYSEYIAINKIGEQNKEVKSYLDAEKLRIKVQASELAKELFGDTFDTIDDVKTKAIDRKNDKPSKDSLDGSLLRKRYDIYQQLSVESEQLNKWNLADRYQQSLLNLAEITGQYNLMDAKIIQYKSQINEINVTIKQYDTTINDNVKSINTKTNELNNLSPTDGKISALQGEINTLSAINIELNNQKSILNERMLRINKAVDESKIVFDKIKKVKDLAEIEKDTTKSTLEKDATNIYTDEKNSIYKFETPGGDWNKDWDKERVKYESMEGNKLENAISGSNETLDKKPFVINKDELEKNGCKLNIKLEDLEKAIGVLPKAAQELFINNPKEFWNVVWNKGGDEKYNGIYGNKTLQKLINEKDRIVNRFNNSQ